MGVGSGRIAEFGRIRGISWSVRVGGCMGGRGCPSSGGCWRAKIAQPGLGVSGKSAAPKLGQVARLSQPSEFHSEHIQAFVRSGSPVPNFSSPPQVN